jgi:hypothetical protein
MGQPCEQLNPNEIIELEEEGGIDGGVGPVANGNDNPVTTGAATPMNMGEGEPGFIRTEPLIDRDRVLWEYMFGIPMQASITEDKLPGHVIDAAIRKAVGDVETSVHIAISPVRMPQERFDFERADDLSFGTRQLMRWPVLKVEHLRALWPGRNDVLQPFGQNLSGEVDYPTSWVTLQGDSGLIRIVPNTGSIVAADASFLSSSAYRSIVLGGLKSWPNMWRLTYIAGMEHDKVPCIVNDLIGSHAAKRVLSMMGPAIFPIAGQAIGLDGMSQSTSTAGPQWLAMRIKDLNDDITRLTAQLKAYFGTDLMFFAF